MPEPNPKLHKNGWGGKRAGAGGKKGNLNALKSGKYSRHAQSLMNALIQDPKIRDAFLEQQRLDRRKQRKARKTAAAILSVIIEGKPAPKSALVHLGNDQEFFARFLSKLIAEVRKNSENGQDPNTISENHQDSERRHFYDLSPSPVEAVERLAEPD